MMGPIAALIVAGGRGARAAGANGVPKQYAHVAGEAVLAHTLRAVLASAAIDVVQVVIHADDAEAYREAIAEIPDPRLRPPAIGGATRQISVANGLAALAARTPRPAHVLIHDAARPFVDGATIASVIAALASAPGAIAAVPVADTLKRATPSGLIAATVDRARLWRAQTPQGFAFDAIYAAHIAAAKDGRTDFTDDAALAEWHGLAVALVSGRDANTKITTLEDLAMAEQKLGAPAFGSAALPDIRTGQGFDVHKFAPGDHVWLCGVRIPHTETLVGHSDADVGLHALTDALLGTIGDGDIGEHFKNTDPRWRGAPSHLFLADAFRRVTERGGRITNVDVTILCEAPKISPHRAAMQARIAEILGLSIDRVGVKATTTETLGFTGRREGIVALAIATAIFPAIA